MSNTLTLHINNSTIYFKLPRGRRPSGSPYTFVEVPYWKLYTTSADPLAKQQGHQIVTGRYPLAQIVDALAYDPRPRRFVAYPRFSTETRTVFEYIYQPHCDRFVIYDKYTAEVYLSVDATCPDRVFYIADKYYPREKYLLAKLFCKGPDGAPLHTPLASTLIAKELS